MQQIPVDRPIVLANGSVLTMGAVVDPAGALAVSGERIEAVGDTDALLARYPNARVIDLGGQTVIPGLIDAHAHMEREGLKDIRLSLAGVGSIDDVVARIAALAAERPAGEWLITMPIGTAPCYFDGPRVLAEGRLPDRWDLDRAAPDHPVYIMAPFGTWSRVPTRAVLNSRALAVTGILDGAMARCGGVEFERDETGRLTGIVIEHNERPTLEFDLLCAIPRFTWQQRLAAVRRSMQVYNAAGTTSIYEGHGSYSASVALYQRLREENALTVRVSLTVSPTWNDIREAGRIMRDWLGFARGQGIGDHWLRISGVYIGFGGNACTAALSRQAVPDTGWAGFVEWCNDLEQYEALVTLAAENDLRVHTVILEDLPSVLPIFERLARQYPIARRRWVMEHVGSIGEQDIDRIRRLGLMITTIPAYQLWKNGDDYIGLTEHEQNFVAPHKSLLAASVPVAIGTDNIPVSLFSTMQAARLRQERATGHVIGPAQCLDGREALAMATRNAAWLSFEEDLKGTLEAGKLADLVVLSDDPTTVPAEQLADISVNATMVGGRFVHGY